MEHHQGGHPRIGAVDVIPFTPLKNVSMEECVLLAHAFGERYWQETGIPVYFYEEAALRPERKRLEVIRKGQYETLKLEVLSNPERLPDKGSAALHPTAGATVIGARNFLVAFNVNLGTTDVSIAKEIAKAVRASSGGFCHVKGIGLALEDRGLVQVSMNSLTTERTPSTACWRPFGWKPAAGASRWWRQNSTVWFPPRLFSTVPPIIFKPPDSTHDR
jgi:glutamate formiminotransferase